MPKDKPVLDTIYLYKNSSATCHIVSKQNDHGRSKTYCRLEGHSRGDRLRSLSKEVPEGKKICGICAPRHKKKMDRIAKKVEKYQKETDNGLFM